MDFDAALARLLRQVPPGLVATCGDLARALGDAAASKAVAERVRANPGLACRGAVVTADGRPVLTADGGRVGGTEDLAAVHAFTAFRGPAPLRRLRAAQERGRGRLRLRGPGPVRTVGAVDVAYSGDRAFAAAVIMDGGGEEVIESRTVSARTDFPYVPGYLVSRELPVLRAVWRRLRTRPDVLLVDGHGTAHPAGFGIACAVGLAFRVPTIGVAKSRLVGTATVHRRGELAPLRYAGKQCGWAYASASPERPIYISPGHRVSLQKCAEIVVPLCHNRIPEPARMADALSREWKRRE